MISDFEREGNYKVFAHCEKDTQLFGANEWNAFSEVEKEKILLKYRLTYLSETQVNWCPALGTVLANDEIVNGVSERGGYPVTKKRMIQWSMRISAFANRLLEGLDHVNWPESLKEMQRNWIGKSKGVSITFQVENSNKQIEVFTTRPDTIFGASFIALSNEHPFSKNFVKDVEFKKFKKECNKTGTTEEALANAEKLGFKTGAFVDHPFIPGKKIPIYFANFVLMDYGTGAIFGCPAHDQRDFDFAKKYNLEIIRVVSDGTDKILNEAYTGGGMYLIHI